MDSLWLGGPGSGPDDVVRGTPATTPTGKGANAYGHGGSAGLLLAAGAGRRYGMPKILVPGWLQHGIDVLRQGGCDSVHVVTGASRPPLPDGAVEIHCAAWSRGIGASLRCGLEHLEEEPDRVVIHLVDCPDISAAVVARVLGAGGDQLARALFDGRPGHPVVVPRRHLAPLRDSLGDDVGAGPYLRTHAALAVECGDLASGRDADTPVAAADLARRPRRRS